MARWSAATLDTRAGRERQLAAPVQWGDEQVRALLGAAEPLGMLATAGPQGSTYDCTVIMGGTVTAHRLRTRLARHLAEGQGVDLGVVVGLGSTRQLMESERIGADDGLLDVEWLDLARVISQVFGLDGDLEVSTALPIDLTIGTAGDRPVLALAAPPAVGQARATTAEALAYLDRHHQFRERLIITSAIYAPYTFFTGARVLVTGFEVIGTPTSVEGDQRLLSQRIGQEVHSAIAAIAALEMASTTDSRKVTDVGDVGRHGTA